MSLDERIASELETRNTAPVTVGGGQFPSLDRDPDARMDRLEAAVAALRAGILELAKEVEALDSRIGKPEAGH
jgi:hypothetical protein